MAHDYYYYYITILLEIYQKNKQYFPIFRCLIFVMLICKIFLQDQSSKFISLLMKRRNASNCHIQTVKTKVMMDLQLC